ncbi:unnamed protein product [Spirodela intermedia]|uniref:Alpha/beta hydrolase fold-3 domain-containing protein n=1 Tax=Spirodela intermedia TaxID=51605 RepID=A0A7I8J0U7_SPIIN|nr:unnamed protein product [Spirodela intermedia]CAA6663592.1 unnamed protein product [Spirodela intermedia]
MSALDDSVCVQVPATPLDEKKTLIEGNTEKFVVDEVSGWLRVFSDGTVDRTWTGPPEVQFLATPYFPSSANAAADGVTVHDLTVDTFSGLALRVYLPAGSEAEVGEHFPVLLTSTGGASALAAPAAHVLPVLRAPRRRDRRSRCQSTLGPPHRAPPRPPRGRLLRRPPVAPSLAQSPPPRRRPPPPPAITLPSPPSAAAGTFSRVPHRRKLRGEPGTRGGGARRKARGRLLGAAASRRRGADPPGFVRSTRSRSEMDCSLETPFLTLDMLDKFLYLALPEGATKDHPITCPMGPQAPEMAGLRMPPVMVVVAERDLIRDTEMEYCEAMKAAGKEVEVVEESGVGHSFYLNKLAVDFDPHVGSQTAALIESIKDFVNRH